MTVVSETDDLLRKLEPVLGARAYSLWYWQMLSGDAHDKEQRRDFLRLLGARRAQLSFQEEIRLPPPPVKTLKGRFYLGEVLYPTESYGSLGLTGSDFTKHILLAGITGSGKTNLMFQIIRELAQADKPFLVFDWKRSYRPLQFLPEVKDLRVIRIGDPECRFRFNPLIPPPGVHPKHWLAMLIDVIKHAFFVAHGPEFYLRKAIDLLYQRFGIYDNRSVYPTFEDVEKILAKEYVRGREMLWMSSTKRALASLTFSGLLGEVLNVRQHESIAELLKGNVVLELDNLATIEKVFLVESLLLWIYHYRKTQGKCDHLRHCLIVEEAHHIMSREKEQRLGEEPICETLVRMIREFGQSVIAVDQEPSKLSASILANTNCKICFTLGNGKDMKIMGEAMNLRAEEGRLIDKLQVGHAIVKLKDRFTQPVHVAFPLVSAPGPT